MSTPDTDEVVGPRTDDRRLGLAVLVASLFGAVGSAMLLVDRFVQLEAQARGDVAALFCNVSVIINCGSVLQSPQAEVFGFPSPVFGLPAFTAMAVLGVVLATGYEPPRWMWWVVQAGVGFGILFVTWLQYVSIFLLGELCPWCMVVWIAMIPLFVLVTGRVTGWKLLKNWSVLVVALWYLLVVGCVVAFVLI